MHKQSILILSIILLYCADLSAQAKGDVWILGGKRKLGKGFRTIKPDVSFDFRQTVLIGERSRIGGVRLGLEFRRVHRFGVGLYGMVDEIRTDQLLAQEWDADSAAYKLGYITAYYERVLYFSKRFELSATLHMARGNIDVSYKPIGQDTTVNLQVNVAPVEASLSAYVNFTWWLSAGGGGGYRYFVGAGEDKEIISSFNGWIYIVKVKIRLGKMVRRIFNEDVKNEY